MVSYLSKEETAPNANKLTYELTKLLKVYESKQAQTPRQAVEPEPTKISSNSDENTEQTFPKDIGTRVHHRSVPDCTGDNSSSSTGIRLKVESERIDKYRLRSHLHGKLHNCSTDSERFEIAKQMMDLQPELDQLNKDLDDLNKGIIPVQFVQKELSADHYVKVKNLKMYIARYQRKIPTATSVKQKADWQLKLEQYEKELKLLI